MRSVKSVGGIDPSSKKIAIVESRASKRSKPYIHVCYLTEPNVEDNAQKAFEFTKRFSREVIERDGTPSHLFLEAPVMGIGGPGATIPQAFISGAIMAGAAAGKSRIRLVNNQTWKKRVLGNGSTKKADIGNIVREKWPELWLKAPVINKQQNGLPKGLPDQDILDAGCINLFGWASVDLYEKLMKRRRDNG